jgi:hypothetical protein
VRQLAPHRAEPDGGARHVNRATAVIDLLQQREKIDRLLILVEEGNVGRVAGLLGK